ncbi:unnamed protein product [Amaranthus hypochondriacus]
MENPSSSSVLLLRNLIMPLFMSTNKSHIFLSRKSKFLHIIRYLFVSVFLIIFHLVCSLAFHLPLFSKIRKHHDHGGYDHEQLVNSGITLDTAIARAIYQLLLLMNSIPTSSRKYEVVRSLAENLIDENLKEGSELLRQVNCVVMSKAFASTLTQIEAALLDQENRSALDQREVSSSFGLGRVMRAAKGWYQVKESGEPSVEKMAAELLWLAHKMEESGGGEVVVEKWAYARNLGSAALAAEPRVQESLVKLTAFLIKHAKDLGKTQQQKETKTKMLTTWLPLLCRASNGTDAPTLSTSERGEIERALEEITDMIENNENKEKVLSLWLHHFAQCPSSDWPNLHGCYLQWCSGARKHLLAEDSRDFFS